MLLATFAFFFALCSAQTYEQFIEKSYDYLEKGELTASEESLRAAMRLEPANPHNYALLSNLGTIQRQQGRLEDALMSYSTALSRRPGDITLLNNRAALYTEMGETDKAIADYTILLIAAPEDESVLFNRGVLYLQQKDFLRAEIDFDKILETNEKTVYGRLGHAIMEKMRGNYKESERIYNYLIGELPKDMLLYEGRADLYFLMEKNARAKADVNKVIVESGPTASLYVLRGRISLAQFEKESAKKDFLKAQEMGYDQALIDELLKMTR